MMRILTCLLLFYTTLQGFSQTVDLPTWKINKTTDFIINGKGDAKEW